MPSHFCTSNICRPSPERRQHAVAEPLPRYCLAPPPISPPPPKISISPSHLGVGTQTLEMLLGRRHGLGDWSSQKAT
jgi:hypothetical protein